jgi:hypothetical protein
MMWMKSFSLLRITVPGGKWQPLGALACPCHAFAQGKALTAYIAFAQPLQKQGSTPTWSQFTGVMRSAFVTHDRQLEARNTLFTTTQTGTVTAFLQQFRVLIARAGDPPPCDKHLLLIYWNGLKQSVQNASRIDPTSGAFWTSFEDLARHTVTVSRQQDISPPPFRGQGKMERRGGWRSSPLSAQLKAARMQLKAVTSHPRSDGSYGRNGGRGKRGGRPGRTGRGGGGNKAWSSDPSGLPPRGN